MKKFRSFSLVGNKTQLMTALELDMLRVRVSESSNLGVACGALMKSLTKKWSDINADAESKALNLFIEANEQCRNFRLTPLSMFDDYVIGEVKASLADWLTLKGDGAQPAFGPFNISQGLMPGPGSSLEANGEDFYTKLFSSPLSYTSEQLLHLYRSYISANPTWARAEKARSLQYGERIVSGSSLSFVAKNVDISRTICTEPSVEMLFQKALGSELEKVLKERCGIKISKTKVKHDYNPYNNTLHEPVFLGHTLSKRYPSPKRAGSSEDGKTQADLNKDLCRMGSLDSSLDGYCTIDLKSASDGISLTLCRELLPPWFMSWLERARSACVTLPGGTVQELFMVSSMGNGFTFPLMTMIFAALVRAVYKLADTPIYDRTRSIKTFGVFGDDIIVQKRNYNLTIRALELFGFTVNTEKSYSEGCFRESCGGDYYMGADVRGVYVRSLKTEADVYSSINRLNDWSCRHGVMLPNTLMYLLSLLKRKLYIPFREDDSCGIKVKEAYLPQTKHYCFTPIGSRTYKVIVPVGRGFSIPDPIITERAEVRRDFTFNHDGLLLAFVGGFIRDGRISQRLQTKRLFNLRRRYVPYWDYVPHRSEWSSEPVGWKAHWDVLSYILTQ
jgi:hypothetical protein